MTEDMLTLDLGRVYLEIDARVQQRAWQTSQTLATPASRWRAYLNQLCLETVRPWLEAESSAGRAYPSPQPPLLPTIWELVDGTAVELGAWRYILLPTEAVDLETLDVPQEWVDIPQWIGDYYLTVLVNLDQGWVQVAHGATHYQIKQTARYDWRDRTYRLNAAEAIGDLNVLWVSQELYPEEVKRMAVAPLPTLAKAQADSLIQRLGQADTTPLPRLAVPFERWGALVAHGGWRRQLAATRWGEAASPSVLDWLGQQIDRLSQQVGWQGITLEAAGAGARGSGTASPQTALARHLTIEGETYLLQVSPQRNQDQINQDQGNQAWRFELRHLLPAGKVPPGLTLTLLTEDLQSFAGNQVTAHEPVESIYIDVELAPGEGLVWQTSPVADQYDSEILRF